jgi:ribosomal protein S18 acetylase RimI-like enzyme
MPLLVREYRSNDASVVRRCIVELQEFERTIDPRLRSGESMADAYWEQLQARCAAKNGRVFVGEEGGSIVGFVAVLASEAFTELDDPPGHYAFVTDLVVLPPYRNRGVGRRLLDHAETFARSAGARELRIGVLARNVTARHLYLAAAFVPHLEILTKRL